MRLRGTLWLAERLQGRFIPPWETRRSSIGFNLIGYQYQLHNQATEFENKNTASLLHSQSSSHVDLIAGDFGDANCNGGSQGITFELGHIADMFNETKGCSAGNNRSYNHRRE